jgi:hypothetical protein
MSKNKNASKNVVSKPAPKLPTTPPKSASVTPIKKNELVEDLDRVEDEDDELENELDLEDGEEPKPGKKHTSQKIRYCARVNGLRARCERQMGEASQTPVLHAAAAKAVSALREFFAAADALPDGWQRARVAGGGKQFSMGTIVKFTDAARTKYADLLEPDEMDDMTVVKTVGNKTVVRTGAGKQFFPTMHLARA